MDEQGVRINKYLSEAGVCSRREADRQIEAGAVTVDGVCARPGTRVLPGQTVCFQGRSVSQEEERILRQTLQQCGGSRVQAMERLGVTKTVFYAKLKEHHIS